MRIFKFCYHERNTNIPQIQHYKMWVAFGKEKCSENHNLLHFCAFYKQIGKLLCRMGKGNIFQFNYSYASFWYWRSKRYFKYIFSVYFVFCKFFYNKCKPQVYFGKFQKKVAAAKFYNWLKYNAVFPCIVVYISSGIA